MEYYLAEFRGACYPIEWFVDTEDILSNRDLICQICLNVYKEPLQDKEGNSKFKYFFHFKATYLVKNASLPGLNPIPIVHFPKQHSSKVNYSQTKELLIKLTNLKLSAAIRTRVANG